MPNPALQRTQPVATDSSTIVATMNRAYPIPKSPDVGELVDSIETLEAFARDHGPGHYDVDEHSVDQLPETNVSARAWDTVIHQPDGRIIRDPMPW
jgi:hypothetical protein